MELWIFLAILPLVLVVLYLFNISKKLKEDTKNALFVEFISIFISITSGIFLGIYFSNFNQKGIDQENLAKIWDKSAIEIETAISRIDNFKTDYEKIKVIYPHKDYQSFLKESLIIDLGFSNNLLNDPLMKDTHIRTFQGMKECKYNIEDIQKIITNNQMKEEECVEYLGILNEEIKKLKRIAHWEMKRVGGFSTEQEFLEFHEKLDNSKNGS
jgi:hypothetical protein